MPVFLFTDIENSTRLWERHRELMGQVISRHDGILAACIEEHGGLVVKFLGDGVFAVFENGRPLDCAVDMLRRLAGENWGPVGEVRVRVALHAGEAEERNGDFFGPAVNRATRLLGVGWGGQILLTPEAAAAAALPPEGTLHNLGIHPLKDLSEPQPILQLVHPLLGECRFPPLRSLAGRPHNLPAQPTAFIGRAAELKTLSALVADPACRLLTLVGPGGAGKTRLALQLAADSIETFPWGAYFVPLAPLASGTHVVAAVAEALKFAFLGRQDPKAELLNYMREKDLLLVIDNFEHVVAGASLVAEILEAAPGVKVLATSRERLNLRGERVFEISGLPYPTAAGDGFAGYEAVQLFLEGARRVSPDFALAPGEEEHVVQICDLVEGMPLGLELASSWVRALSPAEIAAEIAADLDFLATDLRDVPERHRSLRTVFDYSWRLLSDQERGALARLSVFRGGFKREAAREVAGASLPLLTSLVDKSLVRRGADGRCELLEVVRQFAAENLAADEATEAAARGRHAVYYADFLKSLEESFRGPGQSSAVAAIAREIENVRAAWRFAVERGDAEIIDACLGVLFNFFDTRGRFEEGAQAFEAAARSLGTRTPAAFVQARVRARLGWFAARRYEYEKSTRLLNEALEAFKAAGQDEDVAHALAWLGAVAHRRGDYEAARRYFDRALEIYRRLGDTPGVAQTLENLGNVVFRQGEYGEARRLYEESLAHMRELGDRRGIALCLSNLGDVATARGDYSAAKQLCEDGLIIQREIGFPIGIAGALNNLGDIARALSEHTLAEEYYRESLDIQTEIGNRWGVALALQNLGTVATDRGDYDAAEKLHADSLVIRRAIDDRWGIANSESELGDVAYARGLYSLAQEYYNRSLERRRAIGDRAGVAECLNELGNVSKKMGDFGEAQRLYEECYELRKELGDRRGLAITLNNLANNAHAVGDVGKAERLYYESLDLAREIGYLRGVSYALNNLGDLYETAGEFARAEELYTESMAIDCEVGDRKGIAVSLNNIAAIHSAQGRHDEARVLASQGLEISRQMGFREGMIFCLATAARSARAQEDHAAAAENLVQALGLAREMGSSPQMLEILIEYADLSGGRGDDREAAALLHFVLNHPALEQVDRERALGCLAVVNGRLPVDEAAAIRARAAGRTLHEVTDDVLARGGQPH